MWPRRQPSRGLAHRWWGRPSQHDGKQPRFVDQLPTYETLDALAKGLNVSLADFFSEDDTQSVARAEAMARLTDAARQLDDQTLKTAAAIVEVLAGEEGL